MTTTDSVRNAVRRHPRQRRRYRRLQRARRRRVQQRHSPKKACPPTIRSARSVIPAGTGALRDFSYIAPDIPEFIARELRGLHGMRHAVSGHGDPGQSGRTRDARRAPRTVSPTKTCAQQMAEQWAITNKYFNVLEKKGVGGGKFGIFIDPTKCKGCAECVDACGDHDALKMIRKNDENMDWYRRPLRLLPGRCRKRRRNSSTRRRSPT